MVGTQVTELGNPNAVRIIGSEGGMGQVVALSEQRQDGLGYQNGQQVKVATDWSDWCWLIVASWSWCPQKWNRRRLLNACLICMRNSRLGEPQSNRYHKNRCVAPQLIPGLSQLADLNYLSEQDPEIYTVIFLPAFPKWTLVFVFVFYQGNSALGKRK